MKINETSYDKDSNKRCKYFVETKYTWCPRKTRHLILKLISSNLNRFSFFSLLENMFNFQQNST